MPAGQSEIYFLIGENREMIENAPVLESFKAKGFEVLLLTDPIDEFVTQSLHEFKGKKLKAVDRGEVASDAVPDAVKAENQPLLDFMKEKLPDVKEVRLSTRLKESAACLVADEHAMSVHMERLMNRMGRGGDRPPDKRILELNPYHAAISALRELFANDKDDPRLEPSCRLLYDQALLTEGSRLKDPTAFVRQVNELLVKSISKQ
jgi:molecular chaperone HtpG